MRFIITNKKNSFTWILNFSVLLTSLSLSMSAFTQDNFSLPIFATMTSEQACNNLEGVSIPASSIGLASSGATIHTTELISADEANNNNGEFCKVLGAIHPVTYNAPNINFEINLPSSWNGKSLQFGGGGFNGSVVTGLSHHTNQPTSEATPLARGYVTLGSDSGHQSTGGFNGSFLLNDEALRNFGHEQIKKTHDVAMLLIQSRYGAQSQYNYFIGGSQGGHEAFDAVQRYPDDYHGVVAAYPAHNLVMLHLSANRYAKALLANDGASWLSPAKVTAFTAAIYDICDGLDRAEDGIISDVSSCIEATQNFKLYSQDNPIRCEGGADTADTCLSDAQLQALNIMDEPYDLGFSVFADDEENSIFPKWTPFEGSTFFDGGFPNLGGDGPESALQAAPGDATPKYAIAQDLNLDTMNDFEPAKYAGRIAELVELMSANSVNLDRFNEKGGKLIYYHGMADDFIPVYSSIQYWERLQGRYDETVLSNFVRFYTIPGLGHGAGIFSARISSLDALEAWVERGQAPGELIAVDANQTTEGRTRPICHYPEWPRYNGRGDINSADNFSCVE